MYDLHVLKEKIEVKGISITTYENEQEFYCNFKNAIEEYDKVYSDLNRIINAYAVNKGFMIIIYLPRKKILSQLFIENVEDFTKIDLFINNYITTNFKYSEN